MDTSQSASNAEDPVTAELRGAATVGVRFGATFVANVLRTALAFLGGLVVARALGTADYGDLYFLITSFAAINLILDMGSSPAFYTFVSRRPRSLRFFVVYVAWTVGVQFGGSLLILWLLLPGSFLRHVFIGQERSIVQVAFIATFIQTQLWNMVMQLGEARRKTVIVQVAAAAQALIHFVLVVVGWQLHLLTVGRVLGLLAIEYCALVAILLPRFVRISFTSRAGQDSIRTILAEFITYCRPLALYGIVGFAFSFADRWLLQRFGGSVQQGYFSVGQQFANVSLIATTSMMNVFWKETAEALEQGNLARVARLYYVVRRLLFFSAAWLSCFLIPFSRQVLVWTVGPGYADGWPALALMFLVPVQQGLGQVQGTFFFASGDTSRYTRIGIVMMLASIPVTYVLLAPRSAAFPGLDLAAVGLAAKTLAVQAVWVSVLGYVVARSRGWKTDFGYQFVVAAALLGASFAAWAVSGWIVRWGHLPLPPVSRIVLAFTAYAFGTAVALHRRPGLGGLERTHVDRVIGFGGRLIRRRSDPSS